MYPDFIPGCIPRADIAPTKTKTSVTKVYRTQVSNGTSVPFYLILITHGKIIAEILQTNKHLV